MYRPNPKLDVVCYKNIILVFIAEPKYVKQLSEHLGPNNLELNLNFIYGL